jgi:hypothetical protein
MAIWSFPYADTIGEPLVDAFWTPGFTSQNRDYIYATNPFLVNGPGFPPDLNFVTINGNYYDTSGNPLSGYLTFWPSSPLTFLVDGHYTYMPQRYAGLNYSLLGVNQMGDGKIYLQYGRLLVSVLATDNANMTPVSFTYHVKENYEDGLQYDITAPSADDDTAQDIRSLIIPGSERPVDDDEYSDNIHDRLNVPVTSSQYMITQITPQMLGGTVANPTAYTVNFAFIAGSSLPQDSDWVAGQWAPSAQYYLAQILVGPNGYQLAQGSYRVWVEIIATPQVPVFPVGFINIY